MATRKAAKKASRKRTTKQRSAKPTCFVIMPISDPDGYTPGHFKRVYEDIFVPACDQAGLKALRADEIRETNLIHLDVLQRLLEAPIALCDLSSRNPNVLFELGLRQAFDKPVVLVQESGTAQIFDIAPLRYTEYRRARTYHEVLEDRELISAAIQATQSATSEGQGVNSLVRILSLTKPATLPEVQDADRDPALQIIRAELSELRFELRHSLGTSRGHRWDGWRLRNHLRHLPPDLVDQVISSFGVREQKVLRLATGLDGDRMHSFDEIAAMLGMSRTSVARIFDISARRLRDVATKFSL